MENYPKKIRVFISYCHETNEHSELVLSFANQLRYDGLDCWIDQYEPFPPKGWLDWMSEQIEKADFVLIVCSEQYSKSDKRGSFRELQNINYKLYKQKSLNEKYIPIVFHAEWDLYIPEFMQIYGYFNVSIQREYITLYRFMTHQIEIPPLGEIKLYTSNIDSKIFFTHEPVLETQVFEHDLKTYKNKIYENNSSIQILGMDKDISLDSIYVKVHILEKITKEQSVELSELEKQFRSNEQRQYPSSNKSVEGIEILKDNDDHLMVLGKPGAGKTTFFKYITIEILKGKLHKQKIPIFISLKEWSDSKNTILEFISKQFEDADVKDAMQFTSQHLRKGNCVVIMDGLDEVSFSTIAEAVQTIRLFTKRYNKNRFIISCRLAAYNRTFEKFTLVEVADFNEDQIRTFIQNWFKKNPQKAQKCYDEINRNRSLLELATNPLLLTLLCWVFSNSEKERFPSSRADLYRETFDLLIREWDLTRGIVRPDVVESFTEEIKISLLTELAYQSF